MSLRAMLWALYDAPTTDPTETSILLVLADHATDDGRAAWPSREKIADAAQVSVASVKRRLAAMKKRGLIVPGDTRHVAHMPANRRPNVWDLNLRLRRESSESLGVQSEPPTPDSGGSHSTPKAPLGGSDETAWGFKNGVLGVQSCDPQTVQNHPRTVQPPLPPAGGQPAEAGEADTPTAFHDPGDVLPATRFPRPAFKHSTTPARKEATYPEDFEAWWAEYPRKVSKGSALRVWKRIMSRKDAPALEDLLAATRRYAEARRDQDPRYTKHPDGWLNGRRWEDEATDITTRPKNAALALLQRLDGEGGTSCTNSTTQAL